MVLYVATCVTTVLYNLQIAIYKAIYVTASPLSVNVSLLKQGMLVWKSSYTILITISIFQSTKCTVIRLYDIKAQIVQNFQ